MTRKRPPVVLVMAIFNFVIGTLVLMMGLSGIWLIVFLAFVAPAVPGPWIGRTPMEDFAVMRAIPGYVPFEVINSALEVVMGPILIMAGVGLLKLRPWGRWGSIAFVVYWVPAITVSTVYRLMVVNPAWMAWAEDYYWRKGISNPVIDPGLDYLLVPYILTACAIIVVVVLFLPKVSAHFRPAPEELAGRDAWQSIRLAEEEA